MTGRKPNAQAGGSPGAADLRAKLGTALATLTPNDILTLSTYARRRLKQVGLPVHQGEDMVQHAILQVAIGGNSARKGRHPRPADLAETTAFQKYLQGVINSLVDTQRCTAEQRFVHTACHNGVVGGISPGELKSENSVERDVAFRDIACELFRQLHARAPARLRHIIRQWEQAVDCDQIPINGHHRRLRAELRTLAADALRQLLSAKVPEIQGPNQRANLL